MTHVVDRFDIIRGSCTGDEPSLHPPRLRASA
jgi:hypothetical protein